jgi:acetyl/propionyl-CoA carboxylase alpha subunit
MIEKLLIANRGEIAVRVIRSARELGVRTVAVFSDADRDAMYVRLADEAVPIGKPEPALSYLSIDRIIEAARQTGADAVHPGYGFLSERAEFSAACQSAGLIFVGPPPDAMRKLGAKIESKQLAVAAGVPITPGFFDIGATDDDLKRSAAGIGYPIMLKASAGGGGRGMRAVLSPDDFDSALALAREEAINAFGDGAMMVEKLIEQPRHIEVQFLADSHGNVACLFERECTLQRRHQKLIEESPSPVIAKNPALWEGLRDSVANLVEAAGYIGAGTAEFIFDQSDSKFYFLEVNARLQVEHPVTEEIVGIDLVEWQLRIASGERLALSELLMQGSRSAMQGHAIEVRIIAEDPAHGFMPSIGRIAGWAEPRGIGVRVDTGYGQGAEVSRFYDSLLAKLIVHAESRERAIVKLRNALFDFHILGVKTNIGYALDVIETPDFQAGELDTGFLGRTFPEWSQSGELPVELLDLAASAARTQIDSSPGAQSTGVWDLADGFRIGI